MPSLRWRQLRRRRLPRAPSCKLLPNCPSNAIYMLRRRTIAREEAYGSPHGPAGTPRSRRLALPPVLAACGVLASVAILISLRAASDRAPVRQRQPLPPPPPLPRPPRAVWWFAPFLSGGGMGQEALQLVLGLYRHTEYKTRIWCGGWAWGAMDRARTLGLRGAAAAHTPPLCAPRANLQGFLAWRPGQPARVGGAAAVCAARADRWVGGRAGGRAGSPAAAGQSAGPAAGGGLSTALCWGARRPLPRPLQTWCRGRPPPPSRRRVRPS